MKKKLLTVLSLVTLVGCGQESTDVNSVKKDSNVKVEQVQEKREEVVNNEVKEKIKGYFTEFTQNSSKKYSLTMNSDKESGLERVALYDEKDNELFSLYFKINEDGSVKHYELRKMNLYDNEDLNKVFKDVMLMGINDLKEEEKDYLVKEVDKIIKEGKGGVDSPVKVGEKEKFVTLAKMPSLDGENNKQSDVLYFRLFEKPNEKQ